MSTCTFTMLILSPAGIFIFRKNISLLFCLLIPVSAVISSNYLRCKRSTVILLIMSGRPENIFRTDINDRYVEKYDQNISKIRKCPEISKLQSCDISEDSKCGKIKSDTAYNIITDLIIADTVCCDFRKADHSKQTGKCKQAET